MIGISLTKIMLFPMIGQSVEMIAVFSSKIKQEDYSIFTARYSYFGFDRNLIEFKELSYEK